MNNSKIKVSDLTKTCCGIQLDVPTCELTRLVQELEVDNNFLKKELLTSQAMTLIFFIAFIAMFLVWALG